MRKREARAGSLNQTTKDRHTKSVTLSATKGLALRFFAEFILSEAEGLRMTRLSGHVGKCTNVACSDLASRKRMGRALFFSSAAPFPLFAFSPLLLLFR